MKRILLYILINVVFLNVVVSQERVYNVFFLGNKIGEVLVNKQVENNKRIYFFNSKTDFQYLFVKMKTKATTDLVYENDVLLEANVLRIKNEEKEELNYRFKNKKYIVSGKKEDYYIDKKIKYCTANFFFEEPVNVEEVFVERFDYFVKIINLGNHQYKTYVDGGTNVYTYKNGVLQGVVSKKGLSIQIKLATIKKNIK